MLRFMGALVTGESCVKCHAAQGNRVGAVRGGISVTVPVGRSLHWLGGPHNATIILSLGLIWAVGLGVVSPSARATLGRTIERNRDLDSLPGIRKGNVRDLQGTRDIMVSRDLECRCTYFNSAFGRIVKELFGVDAKPGLRTLDLLPAGLKAHWEAVFERVHRGEFHREEFTWKFAGEDLRTYELILSPIRQEGQVGSIETNRDITDRKQVEEACGPPTSSSRACSPKWSPVVPFMKSSATIRVSRLTTSPLTSTNPSSGCWVSAAHKSSASGPVNFFRRMNSTPG